MEPKKPIYLTVEFYLALASLVIGIFVAYGAITDEDDKFLNEKIGLVLTNLWLIFHWIKQYRERPPAPRTFSGVLPLVLIAVLFLPSIGQAQYKPACFFGREQQQPDPRMGEVLANQRLIIQMLGDLRKDLARVEGKGDGAGGMRPLAPGVPYEGPRREIPREGPISELPREAPRREIPREPPKVELPREPGVREIPSDGMPMPAPPPADSPKVEILQYRAARVPVWQPLRK